MQPRLEDSRVQTPAQCRSTRSRVRPRRIELPRLFGPALGARPRGTPPVASSHARTAAPSPSLIGVPRLDRRGAKRGSPLLPNTAVEGPPVCNGPPPRLAGLDHHVPRDWWVGHRAIYEFPPERGSVFRRRPQATSAVGTRGSPERQWRPTQSSSPIDRAVLSNVRWRRTESAARRRKRCMFRAAAACLRCDASRIAALVASSNRR